LIKNTAEAQAQLDQLPEPWRSALKRVLDHPPAAPVDRTITHGERLPIAGGLVVIGTPGHTPGHISLYHQPSPSLLALTEYDIDTVVCYHGGLYRDTNSRIRERIAEIARGG
jgi:glyoxylase-like metal-dependent hydrolase (beta-lactamase superfamily II)